MCARRRNRNGDRAARLLASNIPTLNTMFRVSFGFTRLSCYSRERFYGVFITNPCERMCVDDIRFGYAMRNTVRL